MVAISVVIPVYNAQVWLADALQSVLNQAYSPSLMEIIVVDDGSTDGSGEVAREILAEANVQSFIVRIANSGPSHARNVGFRASSGEYVQFLDADDLLVLGKLRCQIEALEKSGADVAYGDWQQMVQKDNQWANADIISRRMEELPEHELLGNFWCPPAVYLFRRHIVEKIGGWDEELPLVEDVRFVIDCALLGAKFVYCPGIMARYRKQEAGSLSTSDPVTFTQCCLKNAQDVEAWWQTHGGVSQKRQEVLIRTYGHIARASFEADPQTFNAACLALERLNPNYVPSTPKHLALASRLLGYKRAEGLAAYYRRTKVKLEKFMDVVRS